MRAVEGESFSDGKLSVISGAGLHRWFEVRQVMRLMGLMTFGKDMIEVGALLYPRTVNPQDWYQVYSVLTFDSDKQALRQRVGQ